MLKTVVASLEDGIFQSRQKINRKYMQSLDCRRLMANYYTQAGLTSNNNQENWSLHYGGWEEPDQQVRGSFTGHYLSAVSLLYKAEGDTAFKQRADYLVDELELCGREHLDGWCMSIPQIYLDWIMADKWVWAPHYMVHKTLMGLVDAYKYAGNEKAIAVADQACTLLYKRVKDYTCEQQKQMLKWETGGLMEVFADLFEITKDNKYHILMEKFCRYELFDRLVAGEDALTYAHANTTIPEAHGCARAYEVTGDEKFRKMVEAFWKNGIEERESYATGSQNSYELWIKDTTGCINESNQEFCTVYNLIRLADYLYRWSGDVKYADYIEQAIYNGVLTQQNKFTGANTYFLSLREGSVKKWGHLYNDMYCCYGTTVQAQSYYGYLAFYSRQNEITLAQYIPSSTKWNDADLSIKQNFGMQDNINLDNRVYTLKIKQKEPSRFAIRIRIPRWANDFSVEVDGVDHTVIPQNGYVVIEREWGNSHTLLVKFRWTLDTIALSEEDNRHAILWGPVVLAGLVGQEHAINGDAKDINSLLRTVKTMDHYNYPRQWITKKQDVNFRFTPLYEITDENYTIYFPFKNK